MTTPAPGVARIYRRWEAALVGSLLGLSALAWLLTGWLSVPDMRHGLLTGASSMTSMSSTGAATMPMVGLFLVTWIVMMVAMMFPAISPVVVTLNRWVRRTRRSRGATIVFVAGYLLVWTVSGLVVCFALVYLGTASALW